VRRTPAAGGLADSVVSNAPARSRWPVPPAGHLAMRWRVVLWTTGCTTAASTTPGSTSRSCSRHQEQPPATTGLPIHGLSRALRKSAGRARPKSRHGTRPDQRRPPEWLSADFVHGPAQKKIGGGEGVRIILAGLSTRWRGGRRLFEVRGLGRCVEDSLAARGGDTLGFAPVHSAAGGKPSQHPLARWAGIQEWPGRPPPPPRH